MTWRFRVREAWRRWRGERASASGWVGTELGFGGARLTAGMVRDEHVRELAGAAGMRVAARMRRSSAQVRCVERVIGLPIRSTAWMVEEPAGAGAAEREAAALLRENLFGGMETPWDEVLREGCLAIYYGFRVPELVWEERAGLVMLRRVAGRNPELVERWLHDDRGYPAGFVYAGYRPRGAGVEGPGDVEAGASESVEFRRVAIPLEKTLHFAYDADGGNPQGFGLWRSMYQHWYVLQALYKVLAIGIERNLLDVPVGKLGPGAQEEDRRRLLTILRRWRAAEDAAVVLSDGQEIALLGGQRSLVDAMPFLRHHDAKLLHAGLAQFLNLGQSEHGTQALGVVLARIFETSEDAAARWIAGTLNRQLSRRWSLLNYGPGVRPPVIRHKAIRSPDLASWSAALGTLLSGGLLHPAADDEQYLRDLLELPAARPGDAPERGAGRRGRP